MKRTLSIQDTIPSIDISGFFDGTNREKAQIAEEAAAACGDIGFLLISGHGIPEETLDTIFQKTFTFFDLPFEEKMKWCPVGTAKQRGYQVLGSRNLASTIGQIAPPDLRETIFLGPVDDHREYFSEISWSENAYAPNIVPKGSQKTQQLFEEIYRLFENLASVIMRILAIALELPEAYFSTFIDRHFSVLGLHHYPTLSDAPKKNQLRAGAHTDFGAITILAISGSAGGLEVKSKDGNWLRVLPRKGELVVNLGDMMQRWTNDTWVSTLHRVTNHEYPGQKGDRLSIAYFLHPNFDSIIQCIDRTVKIGEQPRYKPITAGEHIRQKMEASISSK
tara:strand:- start:225 stop:1229 length:1005 start_codon:yes stop_codon:yes gene_type:complete